MSKRKKLRKLRRKEASIQQRKPRQVRQGECIFCRTTDSLERHHIIQKRFGGPNTDDNLVDMCSTCHRLFHWVTDQLLNFLLISGKIKHHQIIEQGEEDSSPPLQTERSLLLEKLCGKEIFSRLRARYIRSGCISYGTFLPTS